MKLFSYILIFLFSAESLPAQKKIEEKYSPAKIPCLNISLGKKLIAEKKSLPYKQIVVIDERPDSSKAGYWYSGEYSSYVKLCMNGGFTNSVTSFVNSYLKNSFDPSGKTVLACIKKFWTTSSDSFITGKTITRNAKVYCKVEFYVSADSCYYPLYRYDNILVAPKNKYRNPNQFIEEAFIECLSQLYSTTGIHPEKKCISFQQIESFNHLYVALPVLKESNSPKGLYMNYGQFKNSQPRYTDFEINSEEKADIIYVKGKVLKDSVITDAWGYSNGENLFIRLNLNYFPLFRTGNTFDLYGFNKITNSHLYLSVPLTPASTTGELIKAGIEGVINAINIKSKNLRPYQLDIETGELY